MAFDAKGKSLDCIPLATTFTGCEKPVCRMHVIYTLAEDVLFALVGFCQALASQLVTLLKNFEGEELMLQFTTCMQRSNVPGRLAETEKFKLTASLSGGQVTAWVY